MTVGECVGLIIVYAIALFAILHIIATYYEENDDE